MVFVLEKKENGRKYYYLAHNQRVFGGKWKSYRKYLGKKLPSKKEMEGLEKEFVEEFGIQLEKGFKFVDGKKLEKTAGSRRRKNIDPVWKNPYRDHRRISLWFSANFSFAAGVQ